MSKWVLFDLDKVKFIDQAGMEYVDQNSIPNGVVPLQVSDDSPLISGTGLTPIEYPLRFRSGGELFQLTLSGSDMQISSITSSGTVESPVTYVNQGTLDLVETGLQVDIDAKLPLAGGSMVGPLTLSGNPTLPQHAVDKEYVDDQTIPLVGATLTDVSIISSLLISGSTFIKTHDDYAGSELVFSTAAVTTTDNVEKEIFFIPIEPGTINWYESTVLANRDRSEDLGVIFQTDKWVTYKELIGDTVTQIGSIQSFSRNTGTGSNGYNVNLNYTTSGISFTVDGAAGHTIYWVASLRSQSLTTSGA